MAAEVIGLERYHQVQRTVFTINRFLSARLFV